jgi:hypothetical protein
MDPLNPGLGSFIDSGEEGTVFYSNGQTVFLDDNYPDMVVSEIRRIVEGYRINQLARLRLELRQFNGLHTFSENEIIENFNIFYEQDVDTMFLTIQLEMVSGDYFSIDIPVASPSVPMS